MKIEIGNIGAGPDKVENLKQSAAILLSVMEQLQQKINDQRQEKQKLKEELNRLKGKQGKRQDTSSQNQKKAKR